MHVFKFSRVLGGRGRSALGLFFILVSSLTLNVISRADGEPPPVPAGSMTPATTTGAGTTAPAAAPAQPGMGNMLFTVGAMFLMAYLLLFRPQQKRVKKHQAMLTELKHGDDVVTNAGILGKVTGITDKVVTVEVDDNVRLRVLKTQISQIVKGGVKDLVVE